MDLIKFHIAYRKHIDGRRVQVKYDGIWHIAKNLFCEVPTRSSVQAAVGGLPAFTMTGTAKAITYFEDTDSITIT